MPSTTLVRPKSYRCFLLCPNSSNVTNKKNILVILLHKSETSKCLKLLQTTIILVNMWTKVWDDDD